MAGRGPARCWPALAGALLLAAVGRAQHDAPSGSFAVRCGTLLLGDGQALRSAWLVVVDGKVQRVGLEAPPPELPVVDAADRVVMPGIVAVDSDLAPSQDVEYQLTPDALAVDGFDFEANRLVALSGGVTAAYVSPGRQRLVSGQGAVVKLAGHDIVARVLTENACLRINLRDDGLRAPRVFEPPPHPTDDDPLLPARVQAPTARIGVLAELRAVFALAADPGPAPGGLGPAEHQFDRRPLAAAIAGALPVRAAAFGAAEIRQALQLQRELGLKMVLEDPQHIERLAGEAAAQGVMATFRVPVRLGRSNPGGEDRRQEVLEPRFDAPAKAAAAGIVFGLAPAADVALRDYLMAVAVAVRYGLDPVRALRAIGLDAAAVLGVQDRIGSLSPGKDADFVVLSGDPLAVGTMVESTWIDGRRVYVRPRDEQVLAIRAARVLDGTGRVFRNGVVLVQDRRIKSVGEELAIPYGARVLDIEGGVATPGFIDAFSHLGLAGEGTPVPNGTPAQLVHQAIDHDDPMFGPALAEGITTVMVSGKDSGLLGGRIAAIKTGAADRDGMVLRAIAGQRVMFDALGFDAIKPLADQLGRGKQYVAAWRKYEEDLAAWQKGQLQAPQPAATAPPANGEKPAEDPISGVWEAEIDVQGQLRLRVRLDLQRNGTQVTGTIQIALGDRELPAQQISSGTFEGGRLKLEFRGMGGSAVLEATVDGDTMTGTLSLGRMGSQPVSGTRTAKGSAPAARPRAAAKVDPEGKPKPPRLDQGLEPLRAVLEQRAALVVRTDRSGAIRAVVELLEKEKVPYVLQGAEDVLDEPELLGPTRPPILVGPEVVVDDNGVLRNLPATFAERAGILFGTGDCAGTRHLPLHAAYAVRYGLSPADALLALTSWPARAFKVDDRIGSLEKGKDADLVVFSGDPFEPQSRVVLVVCNGQVVVDRREVAR